MAKSDSTKSKPAVSAGNSPVDVISANEVETTEDCVLSPTHDAIAQLAYSYWEARGC